MPISSIVMYGKCGAEGDGSNLKWKLDDAGVLTITGTGAMKDYTGLFTEDDTNPAPWLGYHSGINSVRVENGVTSIGKYAFLSCTHLTNVSIPSSVVTIGDNAFQSCSNLGSVSIPESVTTIGDSAFGYCSSLGSVSIPASVERIGERAFAYCASLASVTIAEGVKIIGRGAFLVCSSLTDVFIPGSVTAIESAAFSGCTRLTTIQVSPENKNYCTEGGVLFSADKTELVICPKDKVGSYVIPDSVITIAWAAFGGCSGLTGVTIPGSVKTIDGAAFGECSGLTSVTIPESVTTVGASAFYNCSSLASVSIPSGVTRIEARTFAKCSGLTSVSIPGSVTSIEEAAFSDCSSLTSVSIPGSVTSIGGAAFSGCSSLTSVTISGGVTSIGAWAFANCSGLTSVNIPSGVTTIGDAAFEFCSSLLSVTIPGSVTTIGSNAFYDSGLISVIFQEGATVIGDRMFWGCNDLTSVKIPSTVTSIGNDAFSYCGYLDSIQLSKENQSFLSEDGVLFSHDKKKLIICPRGKKGWYVIPRGVEIIGDEAFYDCSRLTGVSIPEGVTSIGNSVFRWCIGLTSVTIPEGVTSIGKYAFQYCRGLTSVTIPNTITDIREGAFSNCEGLADVCYRGTRPQWDGITIDSGSPLKAARLHLVNASESVVAYHPNGGFGIMIPAIAVTGADFTLPACAFTAYGFKEFKAWDVNGAEYAPDSTVRIAGDTIVKALWKDKVTVAPPSPQMLTLTGTITGYRGVSYSSVTAKLAGLDGREYPVNVGAGGSPDAEGRVQYGYSASAPAGQYALKVEAVTSGGDHTYRTEFVRLASSGQRMDVQLPGGEAQSEVEDNAGDARILVGGLDSLIMGEDGTMKDGAGAKVEVTFAIDRVDGAGSFAHGMEVAAIQGATTGQRILGFYAFSVRKTVDGAVTRITNTNGSTLHIVLNFDKTGKKDVKVYRCHDGMVDELTTQERDGEWIEFGEGSIIIHAKKFSVYAIGYTDAGGGSGGGSSDDGGSGSGYEDIAESQIRAAAEGATVRLRDVTTLSNAAMKALLSRKDVTLVMEYGYKGKDYLVTIPAGAAVDNDIPWYGPLYLSAVYGNGAGIGNANAAISGSAYIVKCGDTLSRIARDSGIGLAQLAARNPQIRNIDLILVGQRVNLR